MDDDQQSSISTISTLTDKKRTHFADDEEKNMWKFLINRMKRKEKRALSLTSSIWKDYVALEQTGKTYQSLESHFRKKMVPEMHKSHVLSNKNLAYILSNTRKVLPREVLKGACKRLNCKMVLNVNGYVANLLPKNTDSSTSSSRSQTVESRDTENENTTTSTTPNSRSPTPLAPREPSPIQEIVFLEQITEAIENSQRRLRCALRPEELVEVMLQPPQAQSTPRLVIDHSEEVLQPQQQESLDRSRTSNTNEEFDEMMLQPSQAQFSPRLDIDHTEEVLQPQQQESLRHSITVTVTDDAEEVIQPTEPACENDEEIILQPSSPVSMSPASENVGEMMLQPPQAHSTPRLVIDHTEEVPQPQQQESLHHSRTSNTNKISELLRNQYDEDLDTEKDFHLYLTDSVKKYGTTYGEYKSLLRIRVKLIILGELPLECFFDGIPEEIAEKISDLYDRIKHALSS